ncbi:MAG: hypothetical protein RL653_2157 [Pseudomonadota bacterium]|jgi:hypothetical protein
MGRALGLAAALLVAGGAAVAHPRGAHKKVVLTVERTRVGVLLVLDLDEGERAQLLRAGADQDGDHVLRGAEVQGLRRRLAQVARSAFSLRVGGALLPLPEGETRLSLRQDPSVSQAGISVAVLVELPVPEGIRPGMELVVADRAPDGSPVDVEFHLDGEEGTARRVATATDGADARVRVGRLRAGLTR